MFFDLFVDEDKPPTTRGKIGREPVEQSGSSDDVERDMKKASIESVVPFHIYQSKREQRELGASSSRPPPPPSTPPDVPPDAPAGDDATSDV